LRIDVSEPILKEAFGVLRDKFGWDGYRIHDTREKLMSIANRVEPTAVVNVISYDPPDNRILECAAAAKSDFIVSEDKDLLRLGSYNGIGILTVSDFIHVVQTRALGG
jgi:predicted nucleic acid-binding protein